MKHNVKEVTKIVGQSVTFKHGGMELTATVEMGTYAPYVRIQHRKVSVGIDAKWCPNSRTITGKGSKKHTDFLAAAAEAGLDMLLKDYHKELELEEVIQYHADGVLVRDGRLSKVQLQAIASEHCGNFIYDPDFQEGYDLDGTAARRYLEVRGFRVVSNYDTGRNGLAVTSCGLQLSTNGFIHLIKKRGEGSTTEAHTCPECSSQKSAPFYKNVVACVDCGFQYLHQNDTGLTFSQMMDQFFKEYEWRHYLRQGALHLGCERLHDSRTDNQHNGKYDVYVQGRLIGHAIVKDRKYYPYHR